MGVCVMSLLSAMSSRPALVTDPVTRALLPPLVRVAVEDAEREMEARCWVVVKVTDPPLAMTLRGEEELEPQSVVKVALPAGVLVKVVAGLQACGPDWV